MSEQTIKVVLSHVLTNVANYPADVQARLLGADLSKVIGEATEAVMKTGLVEEVEKLVERPQVSRVEVIDDRGRAYVAYGRGVSTALQDGGKTLKVFMDERTL